ncbi:MAG TPA: 50S ribosomal protein L23 [Myxococcales bacterium]|jgi:large subunit ribosomal protein L23|nr:50S ribosomal protein L23 [Myxococcales bacterium]
MNRFEIIKRPLDTEKLDRMRDRENKFAFEIDMKANKTEVKQAIEQLFKVKVVAVKTAIVRGKFRRIGRSEGQRPNWKKAIVTLKEGDAISLFEGK